MRIPRIYYSGSLQPNIETELDDFASNHVLQILRLKTGAQLVLFNGEGGEFNTQLINDKGRKAKVLIKEFIQNDVESPLRIYLVQGISRGERMDYTIQKAVELGVYSMVPLFTKRCNVKLAGERLQKRLEHWQKVAISACEQCGRNIIPRIEPAQNLTAWLPKPRTELKLTLYHRGTTHLADLPQQQIAVTLLIGPEGGLADGEIELSKQFGFQPICFGPRVLRTETAALTAISILQAKWGDMI